MVTSTIVNSIGLILDIAGVVLVWRYGLPESVSREGAQYIITEQTDERERMKAARFDLLSKIGLGLIIGGFALQLASNFIKS
jgi:hypothetical protein